MGASLFKLCDCCQRNRNTVGTVPERHIKLLLIGLMASGKTEVGHLLSRQCRQIYEPTNGAQYFRMELPERQVSITEVGGNTEMQKIWHHYFLTAMGIIYCFDMSTTYEELRNSFECFQRTLMHPHVRGKPVLLLATKADLADEGVQLYDIENTFQLEALAKYYLSSAHVCYIGKNMELNSLCGGMAWLMKHIVDNMDTILARLRTDANMKIWQDQLNRLITERRIKQSRCRQFQYHLRNKTHRKLWYHSFANFRTKRIRPQTAPAKITATALNQLSIIKELAAKSLEEDENREVPNLSVEIVTEV